MGKSFSWKLVNITYFILTLCIGILFTILTWLPSMIRDTFFGMYTRPQFLAVESNLTLLLSVCSIIMLIFTIWNTWQLVRRDQTPVSSGKLHHAINLVLFIVEIIAIFIIFFMTPTNIVTNFWQAMIIPIALSSVYWIVCAFILKPHQRKR